METIEVLIVPDTSLLTKALGNYSGGGGGVSKAIAGGGKAGGGGVGGIAAAGLAGGIAGGIAGALVSALKEPLSEIVNALKPMLNVLTAIFKVISMMVMPFANLLIPILMPLLRLLTPVAKVLNMLLAPVLRRTMERVATEGAAGMLTAPVYIINELAATFLALFMEVIKVIGGLTMELVVTPLQALAVLLGGGFAALLRGLGSIAGLFNKDVERTIIGYAVGFENATVGVVSGLERIKIGLKLSLDTAADLISTFGYKAIDLVNDMLGLSSGLYSSSQALLMYITDNINPAMTESMRSAFSQINMEAALAKDTITIEMGNLQANLDSFSTVNAITSMSLMNEAVKTFVTGNIEQAARLNSLAKFNQMKATYDKFQVMLPFNQLGGVGVGEGGFGARNTEINVGINANVVAQLSQNEYVKLMEQIGRQLQRQFKVMGGSIGL